MIKKLILPVLALLAITSCSSDELLQESPNPSGQPYISFNTLINNNTRAEVTETEIQRDGFAVNAYIASEDGNSATKYFDKETATYDNIAAYWLENDYYWPGEDKELTFSAWYPSSINLMMTGNNLHRANYSFTEDVLGIDGTDILIAVSKASHNADYSNAHKLTFHHLFAQVIVQATDAASNYKIEIKNTALRYMPSKGGYNGTHTITTTDKTEFTKEDVAIKSQPSAPSNITKNCDLQTNSANVYAFYAKKEEEGKALEYVEVSNTNATTLAGESSENGLKNGFFVQRLSFDEEDSSVEESHRLSTVIDSWSGEKDNYAAYLELDAKLTQTDGTVLYEGKIAVPVFNKMQIKPGNRYIIKLKFTNEGAGQYPPDDEEKGGEPILGKPIHFTIEVDGWQPTDGSTTSNVDLSDKTEEGGDETNTEE